MNAQDKSPALRLNGVDHSARPTWKLKETVEFYRDIMGLPLIHTISARGWGPKDYPDFLHFFFDSGKGSTIAFFYYLGTDEPDYMKDRPGQAPIPSDYTFDSNHTSWLVDTREEMLAWKERLESKGVDVTVATEHEVIESVYFRDPNGYFLEVTHKLRPIEDIDKKDANLTLEAAIQLEAESDVRARKTLGIDAVWNRKADMLAKITEAEAGAPAAVRLYALNVAEFAAIVKAARNMENCRITETTQGYTIVDSDSPIEFGRKALGLTPALWYGLFTGGLQGRIEQFDRDIVRIVPR